MRRREQYDQVDKVGDFWWRFDDGNRVLLVALPNHRKDQGFIRSSWTIDHPNRTGDQWLWDGDEDEPTLSPSLHAVGEWHGFVENGILREA